MRTALRLFGSMVLSLILISCTVHPPADSRETSSSHPPVITIIAGQGVSARDISFDHYEAPIYPRLAQQAGLDGAVRLEVMIDADGNPDSVTVVTSSGTQSLDDAAVDSAWRCKYVWRSATSQSDTCVIQYSVVFDVRNRTETLPDKFGP